SLTRLATDDSLALDARDRRIADAIAAAYEHRYSSDLSLRHLSLFVDHPRVRDESGAAIAIVTREPAVDVQETAHGARVRPAPASGCARVSASCRAAAPPEHRFGLEPRRLKSSSPAPVESSNASRAIFPPSALRPSGCSNDARSSRASRSKATTTSRASSTH